MKALTAPVRQYLIVTGNYWAFTLTDGALRMLVVLHFHALGYSPLQIALLFLFYEVFGVIANLVGGWFGARIGLNRTMNIGLALQIVALWMLLVPASALSVAWVMAAQALSGIAKDLNKLSAKSSIKMLVPDTEQSRLYAWVAVLTGSKNTLKGVGFFLGGALLMSVGFRGAIVLMAGALSLVWLFSLSALSRSSGPDGSQDVGKAKRRMPFTAIFSGSRTINTLAAARLFLFGARDVWFVVALPVYLSATLGWSPTSVGSFLALWVIGYGVVQGIAPRLAGGRPAWQWASVLVLIPAALAIALSAGADAELFLVAGLLVFGVIFAINSSLHSYLIVSHARRDGVSLDVGFYYMANALGRLLGTVLSGWVFQRYGLEACLWVSAGMLGVSALIALQLPRVAQG